VRRNGGPVRDGQLGRLVVMDNGEFGVKLDRTEDLVVPFNENEWHREEKNRVQPMQLARICYEADRALRSARGEYGVAEWIGLSDRVRVGWCQGGVPAGMDAERQGLLRAIRGHFAE